MYTHSIQGESNMNSLWNRRTKTKRTVQRFYDHSAVDLPLSSDKEKEHLKEFKAFYKNININLKNYKERWEAWRNALREV